MARYKLIFLKRIFFYAILITFSFSANSKDNTSLQEDNTENVVIETIDNSRFYPIAVVQALNKTTAKTITLDLKVGERITFGTIIIIAHKCWQAPLDQKPESKILFEIFESTVKNNQKVEQRIFYGWMFASSPSISGLEHPIYDITAINCKNK